MDRVKPGDIMPFSSSVSNDKPTLSDLGVTHNQSSNWQRIAKLPEPEFEAIIEMTKGKTKVPGECYNTHRA